jgi:hypothetical protein
VRGWSLALCVLAAGCGRLDFGERGDAGADDAISDAPSDAVALTEPCNGIDDNGNGIVDEGCPCTPFTRTYAQEFQNTAVPSGRGWLVYDGDVVQLDSAGTPGASVAIDTQSPPAGTQDFAWDGSRVAYVSSTGALALTALDGTDAQLGPSNASLANESSVRWNGSGFDIAAGQGLGPSTLWFEQTDGSGTPLTALASDASASAQYPRALMSLGGVAWVAWYQQGGSGMFVGGGPVTPPQPFNALTLLGVATTSGPQLAVSGEMLAAISDGVFGFVSAETFVAASATLPGLPIGVAATGTGWEVLADDMELTSQTLYVVHLDATGTMTSMEVVDTASYAMSYSGGPITIAADADHTLVLWTFGVDGATVVTHAYQLCR